ncbi:acid-sensing ion channel 2-like [Ptychodera flava]|uniref:acid-sensing ion channel 2-like n=1 Tax=Ptychodera flava TaxID=63121 RepID=UPI00396A0773
MTSKKTKIHVIDIREEEDFKERDKLPIPIHNFVIENVFVDSYKKPKAAEEEKLRISFMSTVADNISIAGIQVVVGTSVALVRRRSAIAKANLTGLFDTMYTSSNPNFTQYDISTTATEQFYRESAHHRYTMFFEPKWQGSFVNLDVLKPILTDFGVCYAFNTGEDGDEIRSVKDTGKSFGFSVVLDAHQEEYNIGPELAVGFQVMLYPQGEVPLVGDLGFAVSVGQEVRIGIDVTNITNLTPPHGSCGKRALKYYDKYSRNSCRMECVTDFMVESCGCKMFYMPGTVLIIFLPLMVKVT